LPCFTSLSAMSLNPNIVVSFAAGLLAFLSPCVLPLIPAYITYIGGVSIQDLRLARYKRGRVFLRTAAFVGGFLLLFSVVGLVVFGTFYSLGGGLGFIDIIAGLVVIILGLNFIFNFLKILNLEKRFELKNRPEGVIGAFIVGMAFGAGWTPCIGPLLQGVFLLTLSRENTLLGVVNLVAFSLGMGLPFLLLSLFFPYVIERLSRLKKYLPLIRIISGVFLVGIGLLILSGRVATLSFSLSLSAEVLRTWNTASPLAVRLGGAGLFLVLAFVVLVPFIRKSLKNPARTDLPVSRFTMACAVVLVILGALHLAGVFNLVQVIVGWLGFPGPESF
jgi:cytochrome c-type biogenesis protein